MKNLFIQLSALALILACCSLSHETAPDKSYVQAAGKGIAVNDQQIKDTLNFTKEYPVLQTDAYLSVADCKEGVTYVNCTFEAPIVGFRSKGQAGVSVRFAGNLSFIHCTFKAPVDLRNVVVEGRCVITDCEFDAPVRMEEASFENDVYFRNNKFTKELRFQNATFHQKAFFMDSECSTTASFQGATFYLDAQFSVTKFYGYTDFSLTHFYRGAFFNYAEFPDDATFNNAEFGSRAEFNGAILNRMEIRNAECRSTFSLMGITLGESLKMDGTLFYRNWPEFDEKYQMLVSMKDCHQLQWQEYKKSG